MSILAALLLAAQQTQSFTSTADTYLSQAAPTTAFGASTTLIIDGDGAGGTDLAALLKWDLSSIPQDSVVLSAEIQLHVTNPSAQSYELYMMTRVWDEAGATWSQAAPGDPWSMPGEHGSTLRGAVAAGAAGPVSIPLGAAGITMVQGWVYTPSTNYGLIIVNSANTDGLAVASREAATASQRPKLVVTYTANQFAGGGPAIPDDGEGFCGATGLEALLLLGLIARTRRRIF